MNQTTLTTMPTQRTSHSYRAVQQETAATGVDWQVFHSWAESDPDFTGIITILDETDAQTASATWSSPTDSAADDSVAVAGWSRIGPWARDWLGRRVAPVEMASTGAPKNR